MRKDRCLRQAGWAPCFIFKSKVFVLLGARYTGQNQPLKSNTSPSQIVNGNKILGFQLIYMLSVPEFKAAFHRALGFQELSQGDEKIHFASVPSLLSPRQFLGEGLAELPFQQKLPSCLDNG